MLSESWLQRLSLFLGLSRHPAGKSGREVRPRRCVDRRLFQAENELEFSPVGSLLELLPAFFHLVSRAVQQTEYDDSTRQRIKYACEFLCSDFREKKDIREFCRTHGWGYENFRKKFAEIMGMPPNQYRMKRRHETACALLMQRTLTIADIARELGYCSPQEFAAKFRRRTGKSPSEYRENLPANYF